MLFRSLANAATARTNLGLGSAAQQNVGTFTGLADKGGQVFNAKAYGAVFDGVTDDTVWFLHLVLMLVLGFLGNDLRQWSLARSGYDFVGMVSGTGITDAERRLFAAMGGPRYR